MKRLISQRRCVTFYKHVYSVNNIYLTSRLANQNSLYYLAVPSDLSCAVAKTVIHTLHIKALEALTFVAKYISVCLITNISSTTHTTIIIIKTWCPVAGRMPRHATSKLACLALSSSRSCRSRLQTPVFVQVVSPPFSWSPLSSLLVVGSPSGYT